MARTVPSLAGHVHGGEGRGTSDLGSCQPLQEGSAHIGRATGGGVPKTAASSTISPKDKQVQDHSEKVVRPVCRIKPFVQSETLTIELTERKDLLATDPHILAAATSGVKYELREGSWEKRRILIVRAASGCTLYINKD